MGSFVFSIVVMVVAAVAALVVRRMGSRERATHRAQLERWSAEQSGPFTTRRPAVAQFGGLVSLALGAVALLGLAGVVGSFFAVVPANNIAIPTSFGTVGDPLKSGIHVVAPWVETSNFSTRVQELSMLRAADEGDLAKDDSIDVIASGGGAMKVDLTIRFSIDPIQADVVFREAGSLAVVKERFIRPIARSATRDVFGSFSAEEGYASKRAEIGAEITALMEDQLAVHGVLIQAVNVRDVLPEEQVLAAINSILQSRNDAAKALEEQRKLVTEAETRRQVAEKDAEALQISAQASADAKKIAADAEAESNRKVAESLTPELVELQKAQACADAIAKSQAQVVTVCSPGSSAAGTSAAPASTTIVVDGRSPTAPAPAG